jgi:hypothetical protein
MTLLFTATAATFTFSCQNQQSFLNFCGVAFLEQLATRGFFSLYAVGFRPFSILFCQNQCKLAKVRVRPHDFQYIRETAYFRGIPNKNTIFC